MLTVAQTDDEPLDVPIAVHEWAGLPEDVEADPLTGEVTVGGVPLDLQERKERLRQWGLSVKSPWLPDLQKKDLWRERLRGVLTPEQEAKFIWFEQKKNDLVRRNQKRKKIKEWEAKDNLDAKSQKALEDARREVLEIEERYPEEQFYLDVAVSTGEHPADFEWVRQPLYEPNRRVPPKTTVRYGEDLQPEVLREDASPANLEQGIENILDVLRKARRDEIIYWRRWYVHANEDTKALAERYGVDESLVAALIAALSPNTQWEMNVMLAEQWLRGRGKKYLDYLSNLDQYAADDPLAKVFPETVLDPTGVGAMVYRTNAEKAQRILDTWSRGAWNKRLGFASEHRLEWNPRRPDSVVRAQREFEDFIRKGYIARRTKSPTTWAQGPVASAFEPAAGRMILKPPLGDPKKSPKVTTFYRSIVEPKRAAAEPVLDGHAINIYYGAPRNLSEMERSLSQEVLATIKEAYVKAAERSGPILAAHKLTGTLTPQQLQAVTWSVWRNSLPKGIHKEVKEMEKATRDGVRFDERGVLVYGDRDDEEEAVVAGEDAALDEGVEDLAEVRAV